MKQGDTDALKINLLASYPLFDEAMKVSLNSLLRFVRSEGFIGLTITARNLYELNAKRSSIDFALWV